MSEAIIKFSSTSVVINKILQNKIINLLKIVKKSIKRSNRINKNKGINHFGTYEEKTIDKVVYITIRSTGDKQEVLKDIDQIKNLLYYRIGFAVKQTNFKLYNKFRKLGKDQIQKAYYLFGFDLTFEFIE